MRAAVHQRYGPPRSVVAVREVDRPTPADNEVLVRVRAASLNRLDWYGVMGRPWVGRVAMGIRAPKGQEIGVDFAGTVEAVGRDVARFKPGDDVFGGRSGAFAEYLCVGEDAGIALKPVGLTFEDAATLPVAGGTALQGLRDKGGLRAGQRALINGASGGVGMLAVQIAKVLGADVTAVCSTSKVEMARSLGADRVVDYTHEDFTRGGERHDVLLDVAGSRSWSAYKRVLKPDATLVLVGGPAKNRFVGPLGHIVRVRLAALLGGRKVVFFMAKLPADDLAFLGALVADGRVTPIIDARYELEQTGEALHVMGQGHVRGKLVVAP